MTRRLLLRRGGDKGEAARRMFVDEEMHDDKDGSWMQYANSVY